MHMLDSGAVFFGCFEIYIFKVSLLDTVICRYYVVTCLPIFNRRVTNRYEGTNNFYLLNHS